VSTLVIAEIGSSHDNDLSKAKRLIDAAKECGANLAKGQWTSSGEKMAARRGLGKEAAAMYTHFLQKPVSWLETLKSHCDSIGIEWACTSYLIEDIPVVANFVKRFKVSAFEGKWTEFVDAHLPHGKQIIISNGHSFRTAYPGYIKNPCDIKTLLCVSKYPAALEDYNLKLLWPDELGNEDGLSDHTTSTLTGALAVAAGATIIEKHIRLHDTDPKNPDYGHSLVAWTKCSLFGSPRSWFEEYVHNIRDAERCM